MNFSIKEKLKNNTGPVSTLWTIFGIISIVLLGALDYVTGYELGFSLFYILPIALVTWFNQFHWGLVMSILSAGTWITIDNVSGHQYSQTWYIFWNGLIRLGYFLIISYLLSRLKTMLAHERELSRIDSLTGALNSRFFNLQIQEEINRSKRYNHPITLAYIDLDNFKQVNDQYGHHVGDSVLQNVVNTIQSQMRETDAVGRLGGDEFALLMPETDGDKCQPAIQRMKSHLDDMVKLNKWSVTFSIGVVTCQHPDCMADTLINQADELMYSIKKTSKNGVAFIISDT
jgi:diguanylate cyclase (GGDEF)-like protein